MKSWFEKHDTEMYSTHNEGKSVVAERFIGTLNNKIFYYLTSISKNIYTDRLDGRVNKYNTYHNIIKMKPVDVKSNRPGIFWGRYHLKREKVSLCSLVRYIIKGSKKQRWVVWGGGIAKISHKTEGCLQQLKIFEGGKS